MSDILISVVVPVFNAAPYLPSLADSFAAQAQDRFEVVFVDDGSTDGSGSILDAALSSGRFRAQVIHRENAGVSAARNAGMARSAGAYLAFVDADDAIAPNYISTLTMLAESGAELTILRHARVVEDRPRFDVPGGAIGEAPADALLNQFLFNPTRFGVYDFLIRRDLVLRARLAFPNGYPYYEDYDFTLRLFNAVQSAHFSDACVYCYRAAPGSAMSTFSEERLRCAELFSGHSSQYLKQRAAFYARFSKWFVARLFWSAMWQACVAMKYREAIAFFRSNRMRARMKMLLDYPDARVRLSAAAFVVAPPIAIRVMGILGGRRTLLAGKGARSCE